MPDPVYEWDEAKRVANLAKHGIDFREAVELFGRPHIRTRSDRDDEIRWAALGRMGRRIIVVAYTLRGPVARLISARAARRNERELYEGRFPEAPDAGAH